jgi:hypothetical protein
MGHVAWLGLAWPRGLGLFLLARQHGCAAHRIERRPSWSGLFCSSGGTGAHPRLLATEACLTTVMEAVSGALNGEGDGTCTGTGWETSSLTKAMSKARIRGREMRLPASPLAEEQRQWKLRASQKNGG